jgi:hypothetical protein
MLTLVGGFVIATSVARNAEALEALAAGLACGAALAYVGLRPQAAVGERLLPGHQA